MKIKSNFIYILPILFFLLACNEKLGEGEIMEKKIVMQPQEDNVWFDLPKKINVQDSVKITLHYFLNLDTLKKSGSIEDRYTLFLYTFQDIPEKEISNVIRSRDKKQFKKLDLKGSMIKDSFSLYYKFHKSGVFYITGFIEDNLSIKASKEEDKKTRKIGTYINQKIIVEEN